LVSIRRRFGYDANYIVNRFPSELKTHDEDGDGKEWLAGEGSGYGPSDTSE
jgi:hypothetical protein